MVYYAYLHSSEQSLERKSSRVFSKFRGEEARGSVAGRDGALRKGGSAVTLSFCFRSPLEVPSPSFASMSSYSTQWHETQQYPMSSWQGANMIGPDGSNRQTNWISPSQVQPSAGSSSPSFASVSSYPTQCHDPMSSWQGANIIGPDGSNRQTNWISPSQVRTPHNNGSVVLN
ncbi:unnamed protein product, partial [Cyprideis torosa]